MSFTPADIDRVRRFWNAPAIATKPGLKAVDLFERCAMAASRRCGSPPPIRPTPCRARSSVREALRRLPLGDRRPMPGRPTPPSLPMSCCRRRAGPKRTAPSPIPNAASRASAPSARAPGEARPDWWMFAEVGRRMGWEKPFAYSRARRDFPRARRAVGLRE